MTTGAIGVLGGTFAPIHNGHLRLAIEAREQLGLDEVRLVPASTPPLRSIPGVAPARRLHWVRLAVAGEKGLVADDCEVTRSGPSYTVDTLTQIRAQHPHAPLCLLLGLDAAQKLLQWHRWQKLVELAHLVVFNRPGAALELPGQLAAMLQVVPEPGALREQPAGLCWRAAMPPLPISASDIRRRLRAGHSVRGLVPDRVLADFTPQDLKMLSQDAT